MSRPEETPDKNCPWKKSSTSETKSDYIRFFRLEILLLMFCLIFFQPFLACKLIKSIKDKTSSRKVDDNDRFYFQTRSVGVKLAKVAGCLPRTARTAQARLPKATGPPANLLDP